MGYHTKLPIVTDGLVFSIDPYNTKSYVSGDTTTYDLTINKNNGTLENGVSFNDVGFVYDGTDTHINFGDELDDVFAGVDKKFTISVWAKYNTLSTSVQGILIDKVGASAHIPSENQRQFSFLVRDPGGIYGSFELEFMGYFTLACCGGGSNARLYRTVGANIQTGDTHEFTISYDGSIDGPDRFGLYVDGIKYPVTQTFSFGSWSDIQNSAARLSLGGSIGSVSTTNVVSPLDGEIYNVKIYNRNLSSGEVLQNYNALKWRWI